jgi:hypothetical protein
MVNLRDMLPHGNKYAVVDRNTVSMVNAYYCYDVLRVCLQLSMGVLRCVSTCRPIGRRLTSVGDSKWGCNYKPPPSEVDERVYLWCRRCKRWSTDLQMTSPARAAQMDGRRIQPDALRTKWKKESTTWRHQMVLHGWPTCPLLLKWSTWSMLHCPTDTVNRSTPADVEE